MVSPLFQTALLNAVIPDPDPGSRLLELRVITGFPDTIICREMTKKAPLAPQTTCVESMSVERSEPVIVVVIFIVVVVVIVVVIGFFK
jgi:hypothetical protein